MFGLILRVLNYGLNKSLSLVIFAQIMILGFQKLNQTC